MGVETLMAREAIGLLVRRPDKLKHTIGLYLISLLDPEVSRRKALADDNPRQDFLDLIDIMVFDYHRQQDRQELSAEQLKDYYIKTFFPIHPRIYNILVGSMLKVTDRPSPFN